MTFAEAIRAGVQNYRSYSGRSGRPAFWYWVAFYVLVLLVATIVDSIIGTTLLYWIALLVLLLPSIAVSIRRLHDIGKSGWWILVGLIPILGWIYLIYLYIQPSDGPNAYGTAPMSAPA